MSIPQQESFIENSVRAIQMPLKDIAMVELKQDGFQYHNLCDLSGTIDRTENPKDNVRNRINWVEQSKMVTTAIKICKRRRNIRSLSQVHIWFAPTVEDLHKILKYVSF